MNRFKCKLKNILLVFMLLVFCITPVLTGCDFSISSSKRLATPKISLSSINQTLSWKEIDEATDYQIYMNSQLVDTIDTLGDERIAYDFSGLLTDGGTYSFYVVATTDSLNKSSSYSSNVCEYEYAKRTILSANLNGEEFEKDDSITFAITGNSLSYMPLQRDDVTYVLYLYSNTTGLNTFQITSNPVNLIANNYVTKSEVYAIRLGYSYVVDGEETQNVIASDIKYYNNTKDYFEGYTDKFYSFDGQINDYYIENQQELNNLIYFTFINRLETFNICISDNFKASIAEIWGKTFTIDNVDYAIYSAYRQIYETMYFKADNVDGRFASQNGNANTYTIKVNLNDIKECNTSIKVSTAYRQSRSTGYYDTTNYLSLKDKYGENYDEFASDNQYLYTEVSTSEQLYWAVENKVTPKFVSTSCRAYVIYQKAKSVLREIISDDMSDYEKALSIFDWISINTSYDYTNYDNYTGDVSGWPMLIPSFYLEGVFVTGYSVCDGFSKAYSLMCNMLGIDCIRIVGDAYTSSSSGGHAWNKVLMDIDTTDSTPAQYYLVDITWTEIMSLDNYEELSHTYFGLSDKDCENTHFPYAGRLNKFAKYSASNNLYYYTYQTFLYKGVQNDLVITSDQEMMDAFDYLLVSGRDTLEIIVDYDYMVSSYNKYSTDGNYKSNTEIEKVYDESTGLLVQEYNPQTDTLVVYSYDQYGWQYTTNTTTYNCYKLRNSYVENVMRKVKFQEQYLFITEEHKLREYDSGKMGMLFIFTQNLLVDSEDEFIASGDTYTINPDGELADIIKYFSANNITGEYYLYVSISILRYVKGNSGVERINAMYDALNLTSNVNFSFESVGKNERIDNNTSKIVFKMTVTPIQN